MKGSSSPLRDPNDQRPTTNDFFTTTPRGTEDLLADELRELGVKKVRQDRGGVRFVATLEGALRVCLWSRIAMRVLLPLGSFTARGADGLYRAAGLVPWEEHLDARHTFAVDATLTRSEHTHSGFVALKIKDAIVDRLRDRLGARPDVDARDPDVRVVAHLKAESLDLSLDLSGDSLFRRGYRHRPGQASLKETLAAAILRAAGYRGDEPLVDPMCGAGTLLIEGALIAARLPPGGGRKLGVERWPRLGEQATAILDRLREHARTMRRDPPSPLLGFDRDEEAVAAARANARAAGVGNWVRLQEGDALGPLPIPDGALLVTNPPYGERLKGGGQKGMKSFYFALGERLGPLRQRGVRLFVLAGNPGFESAFHQRPKSRRELYNGPIRCELLGYPAAGPATRPEPDPA